MVGIRFFLLLDSNFQFYFVSFVVVLCFVAGCTVRLRTGVGSAAPFLSGFGIAAPLSLEMGSADPSLPGVG